MPACGKLPSRVRKPACAKKKESRLPAPEAPVAARERPRSDAILVTVRGRSGWGARVQAFDEGARCAGGVPQQPPKHAGAGGNPAQPAPAKAGCVSPLAGRAVAYTRKDAGRWSDRNAPRAVAGSSRRSPGAKRPRRRAPRERSPESRRARVEDKSRAVGSRVPSARAAATPSRSVLIVSTRIASAPARTRWRACAACSRASASSSGTRSGW